MWRYFFSCLMGLALAWPALAQEATPPPPEEKRVRDFRPSILKLSYDLVPVGERFFLPKRTGYQVQALIDFDVYYLALEYGTQRIERSNRTLYYESEGDFFRLGPEVNLLKNAKPGHALTFGLRYAWGGFSDELQFIQSDPFGNRLVMAGNPDLKMNWAELTTGLHVNVWKGLYMGYTIRYQILRNVKGIDGFAPYDVPGFGLYEDNTGVHLSYFIGWAIPLREKMVKVE